jgi:acyl-CoA synthetase (AMP-forming)/AMP-acid ligase II
VPDGYDTAGSGPEEDLIGGFGVPETKSSQGWQAHLPGVDAEGLDLLAAGSLPAAWRRLAEAGPDRPALWAAGRGWVTRAELDAAGTRVAGRLRRAGLAAGDRVLVSAAASMDLVVAYLGALRMGLVVVPVNTAYREREVAQIHIHGLGVGLHGTPLAGASAVLLPRFGVDAVLDAARDHRATLFFGVPTIYARLAASPCAGELGRLRLCVSGSGPAAPGELLAYTAEWLAAFKRPRVVHYVEALPRNALGKVMKHELRPLEER